MSKKSVVKIMTLALTLFLILALGACTVVKNAVAATPNIEEAQVESVTVPDGPQKESETEAVNTQDDVETSQVQEETSSVSSESGTVQKKEQPFYGVWTAAFRDEKEAQAAASKLQEKGFDASVILTSDWSALNQEDWYAVTAGMYESEKAAQDALAAVQAAGHADAYVKYTGDWQG